MASIQVDLATTPDLVAFRDEIRSWLGAHLTDEYRASRLLDPTAAEAEEFEVRRGWQRILQSGGWAAVHWPREFGGRSATLLEQAIYLQEVAEAGAPEPVNTIGLAMVGPTIIAHGTEIQKALLPALLCADDIWCQLFSEPDAGSDLGNIATRARRTDDGWLVSGQKLWTSWGPHADRGLLLARTGDEPGGRGLTCFLMDMRVTGVTVQPLRQMSGGSHFSEVYLDDVHLDEDSLVGEVGQGWNVAMSTLLSERTTAIFSRHSHTIHAAEALLELAAQPLADGASDPVLLDRAARHFSEAHLMRLAAYDGIHHVAASPGDDVPPSLLLQRLQWGLTSRAVMELGYDVAALRADRSDEEEQWRQLMLAARGWTIGGGTSEIQRNMLSERVLGLPRQPRPPSGAAR